MKKIFKSLTLSLVFVSLFIVPEHALAVTPSITASPISGESELTFRVNPGASVNPAEVKIKMVNTTVKYEVKQELLLSPTDGKDQIDWSNFLMRGLRGTNASGTFHAATDAPAPLRSFNPLYTNTAGMPDEFILVYYLNVPVETTPGSYRGRIRFALTPLAAGQEQVFAFLNVVVNVGEQMVSAETKESIEITPLTGLNTIALNSKKEEKQTFDVEIKINRRFNNVFSIIQQITEPLLSNEGEQLDYAAVNFQTQGVKIGMGLPIAPLSFQQQKIYNSGPNGEAPGSVILTYSLGDLSNQKAGRYSSDIQYYLEEAGKFSLLKSLDLEVENERIFDIVITPEDQMGTIEFRDLKPSEESKKKEVTIEIKTNVAKQYQVNQNVSSDLTNKEGDIIPAKYFTLNTESIDTKGTLKFPQKQEVAKADTTLFISDDLGSSDKFKVIYELTCPWDIKPGDYSTNISYSLVEI